MKNNQENATQEVAMCREFTVDFGSHAKAASKFVGKNKKHPIHNWVLLDLLAGNVVSSSSRRLYCAPVPCSRKAEGEPFQNRVLIASKDAAKIQGICSLTLGQDNGELRDLKGKTFELKYQSETGIYPRYQSVIPTDTKHHFTMDVPLMQEGMKSLITELKKRGKSLIKTASVHLRLNESECSLLYSEREERIETMQYFFENNCHFDLAYNIELLNGLLPYATGVVRTNGERFPSLFEAKGGAIILLMPSEWCNIKPDKEPRFKSIELEDAAEELPTPPEVVVFPKSESRKDQILAQMAELKEQLRLEKERDRAIARAEEETKRIAQEEEKELRLVVYTEKSVVLIGNTRPIKEKLKEIGGRFNPSLTIDGQKSAGWVFSIKKQGDLTQFVHN